MPTITENHCSECGQKLPAFRTLEYCDACAFERAMPVQPCERCGSPLEHSQIGLCQSCQDDDDDNKCAACGEQYEDGGDGWDGMCPDCADVASDDRKVARWVKQRGGDFKTESDDGKHDWRIEYVRARRSIEHARG